MNTKLQKVLGALLMMIALPVSAYDFEVDGIYYTVTSLSDLTCSVTYGDNKYEGTVVIPPTIVYNGRTLTVTGVEKDAFRMYDYHRTTGGAYYLKGNAIHSLTIPNTISSIPDDALYYCTSLDSLIIQDGDTEIDLGRSTYKSHGYYQGPLYNTPTSYVYVGRNLKKRRYIYRSSPGYYDYYYDQFYSTNIKVAEIGDKVTSMPFFYKSEQLEKVILSKKGGIEISDSAFLDCSKLSDISENNNVSKIGYWAFSSCSNLESVSFPNVQTIGASAFLSCSSLESVSIPNVQTIDGSAFSSCSKLETIDLPLSLESIDGYAFWATKITNIVIPNRVKVLKDIFPSCIQSITLGDSIESVASDTFKKSGLETINIYTTTPPTMNEDGAGAVQYMNVNVNVPLGTKEAYMNADGWKYFWNINEVLPNSIESVADTSADLAFATTSDGIVLSGADGQNVKVYGIGGEEVLSIGNYHGQSLSLQKGIYVVKAGKKSIKVML